jgi:acetylornithine deacetylase/succinyl-diaminopimelate desuccinylase-like protein
LVVCLDSGAGNYDQLWLTNSLRGMVSGVLKVEILTEGVHSGDASGLVPSSFRIMRQVLDRLEDSATGRLLPASFHCEVPSERLAQAQAPADILGDEIYKRFPWAHYDCVGSTQFALPTTTDPLQALLNRTWNPTLSVTGVEGMPELSNAGNVLRPYTAFKLSLRLPPLVEAAPAVAKLKALLEDNAPYQARVTFEKAAGATGWNAPTTAPWLESALDNASKAHFGASCGYIGQGGTIPLMNMLSLGFPKAQMMVCGVLGPKSNAHGPNEFLHVPYAKKLTAAVAQVIASLPRTRPLRWSYTTAAATRLPPGITPAATLQANTPKHRSFWCTVWANMLGVTAMWQQLCKRLVLLCEPTTSVATANPMVRQAVCQVIPVC